MLRAPSRYISTSASIHALIERVVAGNYGPDPASLQVAVAFSTVQQARHVERQATYANHVVSLRVGRSVGSCSFEAGQLDQAAVSACVGQPIAALLRHPALPLRIAALDAYLAEALAHEDQPGVQTVLIPAGTSTEKSLFRARAVVDLLDPQPGQRIALIGVVNSLIQALHERGAVCLPCDYNTRRTEWGEPVAAAMAEVLDQPDGMLVTGMTLANDTFDTIRARAQALGVPCVVFAQSGSAVVPRFLGAGVSAVSAEPYPFFWLSGKPTTLYHYRHQVATPWS